MNEERDTDARPWHPGLRIHRVLRVMLHTTTRGRSSGEQPTRGSSRALLGPVRWATRSPTSKSQPSGVMPNVM